MDKKGRRAQEEVELAEAELQVLKQELVVQHLIDTGEPTDKARKLLERVRRCKGARGGKAAFGPVGWPRGADLILSFGPGGTLPACRLRLSLSWIGRFIGATAAG
jgi:hypothetical protein